MIYLSIYTYLRPWPMAVAHTHTALSTHTLQLRHVHDPNCVPTLAVHMHSATKHCTVRVVCVWLFCSGARLALSSTECVRWSRLCFEQLYI